MKFINRLKRKLTNLIKNKINVFKKFLRKLDRDNNDDIYPMW